MAPTKQKPACRQAVRAAVIKAAAELFSAHGVEAVSMRAIAARANVNYGLIHRHFGAKENLLREVHSTLLERLKSVVVSASFDQAWFTEAFRTIQNHEQLWRLEALIGLGGKHEGRIQYGFPLMEDMVAAAEKAQAQGRLRNDVDPKVLVAALEAMAMGLLVFGDMILQGTGQAGKPAHQAIAEILANFGGYIWE